MPMSRYGNMSAGRPSPGALFISGSLDAPPEHWRR